MRATQGVSFPRSGHAAVYHIARLYFGDTFVYCDTDNSKYCGCRAVPCINPERTFAKNHDFGLRRRVVLERSWIIGKRPKLSRFKGVPILPRERYLVQFRSPVPAITSNFKLHIARYPADNSLRGWRRFAKKDIAYWNRFIDKWVLNYPPGARRPLYCSYEDLVSAPAERSNEIIDFLAENPVDESRLQEVLRTAPISARNSISSFEFRDAGFFRELEAIAAHRLHDLGLPCFDASM